MAISFIDSNLASSTSMTMPTHQAGDLLLMWAFRDGNTTPPSVPGGWVDFGSNTGNGCSARLGYKIAASGSETSGTWTNASVIVCMVYRGADVPTNKVFNTGSGTVLTASALTMNDTSGDSWVVVFGGHENASGSCDTFSSTTEREELATGSQVSGCDTNGGVTSWSASTADYNNISDGWQTASIEIQVPNPYYIENTDQSGVAVPAGRDAYVTMIGGGGGGGAGAVRGGTNSGRGGGGGGGGGRVEQVFIPAASLGATYSITRGTGGAGAASEGTDGTDGNASTFVSGSVNITANGGAKGVSGATSSAGGSGGTTSLGGFSASSTESGGNGGTGAVGSSTPATSAGATTHSGPGGGGGGGNISGSNPASSAGGNSSTATGGSGGGTNADGTGGGTGTPLGEGGGGGGGGGGGNGFGNSGRLGGAGGVSGAGGGGGGGKEGSSGTGGNGGNGAIGYTLVEWVVAAPSTEDFFRLWEF